MVEEITSKHKPMAVVLMVAGIYGYFLLFSQFAFLEMVKSHLAHALAIKAVLACMALGGVVGGFWVARSQTKRAMDVGMLGCALAAWLATLTQNGFAMAAVSLMMGVSLGMVTTSLAARMGQWLWGNHRCLWVGVGTGLGYALCNVPQLFQAAPQQQAYFAAAMIIVGYGAYLSIGPTGSYRLTEQPTGPRPNLRILLGGVMIFFAMVWLDSAAFYVIQHAPEMKKATWGAEMLWRNALLHAVSAVAAGYFLDRGFLGAAFGSAAALLSPPSDAEAACEACAFTNSSNNPVPAMSGVGGSGSTDGRLMFLTAEPMSARDLGTPRCSMTI
jgi:cytochrome c oxidase cbb3-type subunit 2